MLCFSRGVLLVSAAAILAGCASPAASTPVATARAPIAAGRCDTTLPSRAPVAREAAPPSPLAPSTIPVDVSIDLARLVGALEAEVPSRVVEDHDRDVGTAGRISYVVDRGPLTVSVEEGRLVVRAELAARAAVCKPIGILGCVGYASCEPTALATASVPARLTPSYAFGPAAVSVEIRRRCLVTALGIDVTPMLEARVRAEGRKLQERIDRVLPTLRPEAERLWSTLSSPIPLRDGARATLDPRALLQAPAAARVASGALLLRFGVVAAPHVSTGSDPAPPASTLAPLPMLRDDPSLGDAFALQGRVEVSPDALDRDAATRLAGATLDAGDASVRVESVHHAWSGEDAATDVTLSGPVCGEVSFDAHPAWDAAHHVLAFALTPAAGEAARVQALAPRVDLVRLARALETRLAYAPPVDDASLAAALDGVALPLGAGASLRVALAPRARDAVAFARGQLRLSLAGHAQIDVKAAR